MLTLRTRSRSLLRLDKTAYTIVEGTDRGLQKWSHSASAWRHATERAPRLLVSTFSDQLYRPEFREKYRYRGSDGDA